MPKIHQQKCLPFEASVLYDLVLDVSSYPEFLPWCKRAQVHCQDATMQEATLVIAKGPMRHRLTTHNVCIPNQKISMYLLSGPLQHLSGAWNFEPVGGGTRVTLSLDFDFDLPIFRHMMNVFFEKAMRQIVQAFETRAHVRCDA